MVIKADQLIRAEDVNYYFVSDYISIMPGGVKTRNTVSSHLSTLVGTGRELTPSELPTTRDLLRLGIFFRETSLENRRNYCVDDLVSDIVGSVAKGKCSI